MRVYGYLRIDPNVEFNLKDGLVYFSNNGYDIPSNRLISEEAAVEVSVFYRDKLSNLVQYSLEENDVLIIKGIDSLGSNFNEVSEFISIIDSRKIILVCLEYSKNKITGDLKKIFFHFIKIAANFELKLKLNRKFYQKNSNNRVGRPEKLNDYQKKQVIQKYKKGYSVYALAREYSVTRTVIQRILNKESEKLNL